MYRKTSLQEYIDELAARKPVPGGGSAAALCGALGTALLEMVCNFTVGKIAYKSVEPDIKAALASLKRLRQKFVVLINEDARVYLKISRAFKRDKKNIDKSLKDGYYVSEQMCEMCVNAMRVALNLSQEGNVNLTTDVGCGAELLRASFNAGIFNAEINLRGLKDKRFIKNKRFHIGQLEKEITVIYKNAIAKVRKKMR